MAIIWMDGFEHYGTSSTGRANMVNYGAYSNAGITGFSTTVVRTGLISLQNPEIVRSFKGSYGTVGVGCALYFTNLNYAPSQWEIFQFFDPSSSILIHLGISNAQEIIVFRGNGTTEVGRSAAGIITTGAWNHFEVKFSPNGATSAIEVRVNEVTVYTNNSFQIGDSGTGLTATTTSAIEFYSRLTTDIYLDDLYAWNTSGSYNNDFIGDKRVATMYPDGDTAEADWTPNSGGTGYTQIDEATPDGDTTYVSTATVGHISEFNFQSMPTGAIGINAVQIYTAAKKTDTGTCDVRTDIVSGAFSTAGPTQTCTTAYVYKENIFETDPNTGALWTKAGVDAAKIRIEREA